MALSANLGFSYYTLCKCVCTCVVLEGGGGRENGSRHENCKAKREKKVFPSLPLSLAPGQTKLMGREKKKTPFSPCPTFDQQGLRFEEWGEKVCSSFVFWSSSSGFKSRSSAHKVSPACAYGGGGIRTVCVHAKREGGGEDHRACLMEGKPPKSQRRRGRKKVLHFKCPFLPPHDAALGEI